MIAYIIKSSLCLILLWGFYKLFLEKENIHFVKRFYLLFSLVFAFSVPFVTLTYEVEVVPQPEIILDTAVPMVMNVSEVNEVKEPINYISIIVWSLYGIGVLIFGIRFIKNLIDIGKKVRRNERLKETSHVNVLVGNSIVPHTFLDFIFVPKKEFQEKAIPKEILVHEKTHVLQKHTLDILFVELLQVIFWFNPVFIFIKKSIRLNHEFLADQNVLKQQFSIQSYVDLLLNYKNSSNQAGLSSPINYSLTKKRLQMMTKNFSRKKTILKMLAVLPLLAIGLLSFNNDIVAKEIIKEVPERLIEDDFELTIDASNNLYHEEKKINIDEVRNLAKEYVKLNATKKTTNASITFHQEANKDLFILPLLNELKDLGMDDIKFKNENFVEEPQSFEPSTTTDTSEKRTMTISKNWEKKDVQDGVTKEMVKEYDVWAKNINAKIKGNKPINIKQSEIYRMIDIYRKMTAEQRKGVEQFPDIPPPPPVPESPKVMKGEKSNIPPPPPPPAPEVKKGEKSDIPPPPPPAPEVKKGEKSDIPPPPPPAPKGKEYDNNKSKKSVLKAEVQRELARERAELAREKAEIRREEAMVRVEESRMGQEIAMLSQEEARQAAENARENAMISREAAEKARAMAREAAEESRERSEKSMRKAEVQARKAEKEIRMEEMKARKNAQKAELEARKVIRKAEMNARKAEMEAEKKMRRAEMNAMRAEQRAARMAENNTPDKLIERMAKNDADFYYNGKQISAKEALKLVEGSNNKISIDASTKNGKSKVKLKD
ncbi:M56 family metallopeptidase [Aquimarina latercula]|uniref:M56 family metallopeptidase n=1 Tax=Aquimarina latercula TaxID=987 RepID=UPI000424BE78|nr:M56 family metallopeptidase [Aquimarina latercula]